jgi:hypothetical protein
MTEGKSEEMGQEKRAVPLLYPLFIAKDTNINGQMCRVLPVQHNSGCLLIVSYIN